MNGLAKHGMHHKGQREDVILYPNSVRDRTLWESVLEYIREGKAYKQIVLVINKCRADPMHPIYACSIAAGVEASASSAVAFAFVASSGSPNTLTQMRRALPLNLRTESIGECLVSTIQEACVS